MRFKRGRSCACMFANRQRRSRPARGSLRIQIRSQTERLVEGTCGRDEGPAYICMHVRHRAAAAAEER